MNTYAGVGSRKTPPDILRLMEAFAHRMALDGLLLRTGGAEGADLAFERGARLANGEIEVYRPHHVTEAAMQLAAKHHPAWHRLSPGAKLLIARNGFQVLGANLDDPVLAVVCWTPDGVENGNTTAATGGTGQAIRLAAAYGIEVYNLANPETRNKFARMVEG